MPHLWTAQAQHPYHLVGLFGHRALTSPHPSRAPPSEPSISRARLCVCIDSASGMWQSQHHSCETGTQKVALGFETTKQR